MLSNINEMRWNGFCCHCWLSTSIDGGTAWDAGTNIIEVPGKNWMSQGKEKTWPQAHLTILVIHALSHVVNTMFPCCTHDEVNLPLPVGIDFDLTHVMGFGGEDFGFMEVGVIFLLKLCCTTADLSSCPRQLCHWCSSSLASTDQPVCPLYTWWHF